jgi:hypothetical protein
MQRRFSKGWTLSIGAAASLALAANSFADLTHRYSFNDGTANDSIGSAHASLLAGATVSGGKLQLASSGFQPHGGPHANINPSVLPATGNMTIEMWFTFTGSGFFTESWAFSNNNNETNPPGETSGQYLMHTISNPQGGPTPAGGGSSIAQTLAGYGGGAETRAFGTTTGIGAGGGGYLDDGGTYMAAAVIDGSAATLSYYVFRVSDGAGGLQSSIPAIPLSSYSFTNLYLGQSPFTADNSTSGAIDEFRIYTEARSPVEIAADFALGPNVIPEPATLALGAMGMLSLVRRPRARK